MLSGWCGMYKGLAYTYRKTLLKNSRSRDNYGLKIHIFVIKNLVIFNGCCYTINIKLKTIKGQKYFWNYVWKIALYLNMHRTLSSRTNFVANKFCTV